MRYENGAIRVPDAPGPRRRARPRQARALPRALPRARRLSVRSRPGPSGLVRAGAERGLGRPDDRASPGDALRTNQDSEETTMGGRLAGKVALITAAGQGIGQATRAAMAREGAQVYATDVKPELLESYRGVANVVTRPLDVLDDAAVARTFEELPPLVDPLQLRRLRAQRHDPRLHAEGLGLQLQPERPRAVRRDPRRAAEDARAVRADGQGRQHHQHGVDRRLDQRAAQPLRLRRIEGGRDRPHQGGRRRLRAERHPLQRDRAGHRRHAVAARPHQRVRRPRGGAPACSSRASRWGASRSPRRSRR